MHFTPRSISLLVILLIVCVITIVVVTRPAFRQDQYTVVIREPGHRFLGSPRPAQRNAAEDLDYALLSQAAYTEINKDEEKDTPNKCKSDQQAPPASPAAAALYSEHWERFPGFPDADLQTTMCNVHLRAEVWVNRGKGCVVVAFGGTVFKNLHDWQANLRWFNPFRKDEYTVVVHTFAPAFAKAYALQQELPNWEFLRSASLYSTGHSLGGGLAEEFAYSVPIDRGDRAPVTKVYAFDPSPVTGFLSVKRERRNENKTGLQIDRIYERGEVLAIARSITSIVHKPPAANPQVRQLRYNLFGNDRNGITNVIAGHSIDELAAGLGAAAAQPQTALQN